MLLNQLIFNGGIRKSALKFIVKMRGARLGHVNFLI